MFTLSHIFLNIISNVFDPPYSPDCNKVELLWPHVNREVAKKAPQTLDELKRALKLAWDRLPQELINDICSGYDRVLAQVVAKKGGFA